MHAVGGRLYRSDHNSSALGLFLLLSFVAARFGFSRRAAAATTASQAPRAAKGVQISTSASGLSTSASDSRPADVVGRSGPQSLRQRSRAPNGGREDGFSGMRLRHGSAEHVPDPNRSASMILNPVPTLCNTAIHSVISSSAAQGFPARAARHLPGRSERPVRAELVVDPNPPNIF